MAVDHSHDPLVAKLVTFLNWLATALGIGTFLGFVNIVVGVLSAGWLFTQLWTHFTHTVPIKKEELRKLRRENDEAERRGQDHGTP